MDAAAALLASHERLYALRLAASKYDLDAALMRTGVRSLFEASLADIWRSVFPGRSTKAGPTQRLGDLLGAKEGDKGACPGLDAYIRVAAAENGVGEELALRAARQLYSQLSSLAHSSDVDSTADGAVSLPTTVFASWGSATLVVYAAIVSYSRRGVGFYVDTKEKLLPLKLRTLREADATVEAIRASALL